MSHPTPACANVPRAADQIGCGYGAGTRTRHPAWLAQRMSATKSTTPATSKTAMTLVGRVCCSTTAPLVGQRREYDPANAPRWGPARGWEGTERVLRDFRENVPGAMDQTTLPQRAAHGEFGRADQTGCAVAARSVLGGLGRFSAGVWLARQSADFAEEPLEGSDLVAERPPPPGGDLYPGAWAAIARCLALGN